MCIGMFRGKAILTGEYVYGYLYVATDKRGNKQTQILVPDNMVGYSKMYAVEEDSVEQELRMRDTLGRKIYEGDKISVEIGNVVPVQRYEGIAEMHKGCASVRLEQNSKNVYIQLHLAKRIEILESHGNEDKWKGVNK